MSNGSALCRLYCTIWSFRLKWLFSLLEHFLAVVVVVDFLFRSLFTTFRRVSTCISMCRIGFWKFACYLYVFVVVVSSIRFSFFVVVVSCFFFCSLVGSFVSPFSANSDSLSYSFTNGSVSCFFVIRRHMECARWLSPFRKLSIDNVCLSFTIGIPLTNCTVCECVSSLCLRFYFHSNEFKLNYYPFHGHARTRFSSILLLFLRFRFCFIPVTTVAVCSFLFTVDN